MYRLILISFLIAQPLFFVHCSKDSGINELSSSPPDTSFITVKIDTAFQCLAVYDRQLQTFRTDSSWIAFWNQYVNGSTCTAPEIIFDENIIIGVFWGSGVSGCGNTEFEMIQTIYMLQDTLFVYLDVTGHSGPCLACTQPNHLAIIEKNSYPVKFVGPLIEFWNRAGI